MTDILAQGRIAEQYKTSGNLDARIQLHAHFSLNPYPWYRWVFDYIDLPARCRILELGCGNGGLWRDNLLDAASPRIPRGWKSTLSDFSPGMLDKARRTLDGLDYPFTFSVMDARAIAFQSAVFDAVIANHMLYHVPDRVQALSEIRRVLKPGGKFYATTVGESHMRELWSLAEPFMPGIGARTSEATSHFTLENGLAQLQKVFTGVTVHLYDDALVVSEVEPLLAYVASSIAMLSLKPSPAQWQAFAHAVARVIATRGAIHISKASGLFAACRP